MSMHFHLSVKSKRRFCKLEEDLADGLFILPTGQQLFAILKWCGFWLEDRSWYRKGKNTSVDVQRLWSPASSTSAAAGSDLIGEAIKTQGRHGRTAEIIKASWRQSTKRQYISYLKRWKMFCIKKKCTPDYYLPSWQIKCQSRWTVKKVQWTDRMEAKPQSKKKKK